jgi:large subunit ribosomal protein L4
MATLTIRDPKGSEAGTVDVSDAVFGVEPNKHAVRQALIAYQANQRQGTHSTKTRAFVRGGGRKPWKQKGTGRARQGSIRAPQWRGGAVIFGPSPRDYNQKVNKKVRRLALYSALSDLRSQEKITVLKDFALSSPSTKGFIELLDKLNVGSAQRILVLVSNYDDNLSKSARNLGTVIVSDIQNINIYNLLTCDHLVATPDTLKALEKQISSEAEAA